MLKVAIKLSYNGLGFFGFQIQGEKITVAYALKKAFESIGIFNPFIASGRTDKGVHASSQVISLEIPHFHKNLKNLQELLNTKLYPHIKIKQIWEVEKNFNARFHAKKRGYCYILSKQYSPFLANFSHCYSLKNRILVQQAMECFKGVHNFKAFMRGGENKNYVREIYRVRLVQKKEFDIFSFVGNGFLRSQIRLMVGFLLEIDKGKLTLEDLKRQLNGEMIFRIPAPAQGLFLSKVCF